MTTTEDPFATPLPFRDPARRLRGRLVAPVTLWTSGTGGDKAGLTVSSVLIAEGDPANVVGLIGPMTDLWDSIATTGAFVVHVLEESDRRLAERFAGTRPTAGGPFHGLALDQSRWGPVIVDVATRAFCRVTSTEEVGYHGLVRAALEHVEIGAEIAPLVYLMGRFRRLVPRRPP